MNYWVDSSQKKKKRIEKGTLPGDILEVKWAIDRLDGTSWPWRGVPIISQPILQKEIERNWEKERVRQTYTLFIARFNSSNWLNKESLWGI